MRTVPIFIVGAAVVVLALGAQSKRSNRPQGKPGVFDYYVLSLSWSPQHCAGPSGTRDSQQCGEGKRFGFVVHGLWPQYERGFPDSCAAGSQVAPSIVTRLLPLMPSGRLIQHEWDKHGTCSGLSQASYFETIEKTFARLKVPDDYKTPLKQVMVKPGYDPQQIRRRQSGLLRSIRQGAVRRPISQRGARVPYEGFEAAAVFHRCPRFLRYGRDHHAARALKRAHTGSTTWSGQSRRMLS